MSEAELTYEGLIGPAISWPRSCWSLFSIFFTLTSGYIAALDFFLHRAPFASEACLGLSS